MEGEREREFSSFVRECAPALSRLAAVLDGDPHGGQDLVQTALMNLWRSWPRARDADKPLAYARRALVKGA